MSSDRQEQLNQELRGHALSEMDARLIRLKRSLSQYVSEHSAGERPEAELIISWLQTVAKREGALSCEHLKIARLGPDKYTLEGDNETNLYIAKMLLEHEWDPGRSFSWDRPELMSLISPDIHIARFKSAIACLYQPRSLMLPNCSAGMLLGSTHEALSRKPDRTVVVRNSSEYDCILNALASGRTVEYVTDLKDSSKRDAEFDMIIANLPDKGWNFSSYFSLAGERSRLRRSSSLIALWSCQHLTEGGVGLLLVDHTFFSGHNSTLLHQRIKDSGCGIEAAFFISREYWWNSQKTNRDTYLVVIKRGLQSAEIFAGEYRPEQGHIAELVSNFQRGQTNKDPSQGRKVDASSLISYRRFLSKEDLCTRARSIKLQKIPSKEIFEFAHRVAWLTEYIDEKHGGKLPKEFDKQLLYYSVYEREFVLKSELSTWSNDIFFWVRTEASTPEFLCYWFNSTEIGRKQLLASRRADTRDIVLDWKHLASTADIFLPSRTEQRIFLDARSKLIELESTIKNLGQVLSSSPAEQVCTLNMKLTDLVAAGQEISSLANWCEDLPFPIASILRRYEAVDKNTAKGWETLLSSLEASCLLIASIYLSALEKDVVGEDSQMPKLLKSLRSNGHSLLKPTFGTWKCIVENLGKYFRDKLNDRALEERILRQFGCSQSFVIKNLVSKSLPSIFEDACTYRNDYKGHGGIVDGSLSGEHEQAVKNIVMELRKAIGPTFRQYKLVRSSHLVFIKNKYNCRIEELMGHATPFVYSSTTASSPMEDGTLYLSDPYSGEKLKLIRFLDVRKSDDSSAETAFFYSRWNPKERLARMISYDNPQSPERYLANESLDNYLLRIDRLYPPESWDMPEVN